MSNEESTEREREGGGEGGERAREQRGGEKEARKSALWLSASKLLPCA